MKDFDLRPNLVLYKGITLICAFWVWREREAQIEREEGEATVGDFFSM